MSYDYDRVVGSIEAQIDGSMKVFEAIADEVVRQINSDDESPWHVGRDLWNAYRKNPEAADAVLIAICGWSMKSILIFAGLIEDDEGLLSC